MTPISRRTFMLAGTTLAGMVSTGMIPGAHASGSGGFTAASETGEAENFITERPGIQRIFALTEVTGGGEKVYGIAVEYE
ncbi:hypothetical protein [Raoultella ornithinolytica]|uniref:hypothetical protein n=1 Tax=Raoultella ornithinolytica TaxID=54291 RepID=UPI00389071B6